MQQWTFLILAIVAEVIGTSALKASAGFSKLLPSLLVVSAFAVCFYFLSRALLTIPVGVAYAIWSGAGIVLITLIGWLLFKQKLDTPALLGIALIVAGVAVIHIFSKSITH